MVGKHTNRSLLRLLISSGSIVSWLWETSSNSTPIIWQTACGKLAILFYRTTTNTKFKTTEKFTLKNI